MTHPCAYAGPHMKPVPYQGNTPSGGLLEVLAGMVWLGTTSSGARRGLPVREDHKANRGAATCITLRGQLANEGGSVAGAVTEPALLHVAPGTTLRAIPRNVAALTVYHLVTGT
jgi:hypothetical protein